MPNKPKIEVERFVTERGRPVTRLPVKRKDNRIVLVVSRDDTALPQKIKTPIEKNKKSDDKDERKNAK